MSREIRASGKLRFKLGDTDVVIEGRSVIDVSGDAFVRFRQNVGTSEEALEVGDIGTLGWAFFINHDATNYVEISSGSGVQALIRVEAGEIAGPFRLSQGATLYATANTAAVDLEGLVIED